MAFNICRFKWWPTVQGGVRILRQINHQKDVVITTLSGRTVQKKQNNNNDKKGFCHYVYEFKTIYLQLVNKKRSVQMYLCDC